MHIGHLQRRCQGVLLATALSLSSCHHAENYDKTVADGVLSIPVVGEFAKLFPKAHHFISYYTGQRGRPTWNSEVVIARRYVLSVQLPIAIDQIKSKVIASGAPKFLLLEVTHVSTLPNGNTDVESGRNIRFGMSEWRRFVETHGDLAVLGLTGPIMPVENFDKIPGEQLTKEIQKNELYTGSCMTEEAAIAEFVVIFVREVQRIGDYGTVTAAGGETYHGVQVAILQNLKGSIASPTEVECFVSAVEIKNLMAVEAPPKAGRSYVFFVRQVPGWNIAMKIIPATDDNTTQIKQIIAQHS